MANLSIVNYRCVDSKAQVLELDAALNRLKESSSPVVANDWGRMWLGCAIHQLGGDWKEFDCRGVILYAGLCEDGSYEIEQETAWGEQSGFRQFLMTRFPTMTIYFKEEEVGTDLFYTNDVEGKYFPERFLIEWDDARFYFKTLDEASLQTSAIVGYKVRAEVDEVYEAVREYSEQYVDRFLSFHRILCR